MFPGTYLCFSYYTTMQKVYVKHIYLVKCYQLCDLLPKSTMWIVTRGWIAVQILQFFYIVQKYVFASFPTRIPSKQLESLVHISACYTPNARSPVNHEAHTFPSRGGQAILPTIAYVAITHGYSALEFPFIEHVCMYDMAKFVMHVELDFSI